MDQDKPKRTRGKQRPKVYSKPELIARYVTERALGTTKADAAEKLGVSRRSIYHLEKAESSRLEELIRDAGEYMTRTGLPVAIDNIIQTIQLSQEQPPDNISSKDPKQVHNEIKLRKLANDCSESILKASGILPTQTAAPVIQSLTVTNQTIMLPSVRLIVEKFASEVIDVTPEEPT